MSPASDTHEGGSSGATEDDKAEESKGSPGPPPALEKISSDGGESQEEPFGPLPVIAKHSRHGSRGKKGHRLSGQSPFDDDTNDSASEYSVPSQEKQRQSAMLEVPEGRKVNEDGISEMTVSSSRGNSHRQRLNQRASDEISVVSALEENEGSDNRGTAKVERRSVSPIQEHRD